MSSTTRHLLGFLAILMVAFYFLMGKLTDRVERQYLEAAEEPMVDFANTLAALLERQMAQGDLDQAALQEAFDVVHRRELEAPIYDVVKRSVDLHVYLTDAKGVVLFDSQGGEAVGEDYSRFHDVMRTLRGHYGARSTRTDEADDGSSIMYVGAPLYRDGAIVGVLSVSKPQANMFVFMAGTRRTIRFYGWTILLSTMLVAVIVSHWFASPIRKLRRYAEAVRRGERVAAPRLTSTDVQALGTALEAMRDSLEDRKYVESYVQSLTHEMKSPVAGIQGAAELLEEAGMPEEQRRHFLANIQFETARLQRIIDQLLALSTIESMKSLKNPSEIDLAQVVDEVCASQEHLLEAKALQVRKQYGKHPTVRGEAFLLKMALGNLLQNAIDFSPVGSEIRIALAAHKERALVEVRVQDTGPGVPEYARERIFQRFYSLPHPNTGKKSSGLGLCFVQEAAALHGGSARLEPIADGEPGACFVISLKA